MASLRSRSKTNLVTARRSASPLPLPLPLPVVAALPSSARARAHSSGDGRHLSTLKNHRPTPVVDTGPAPHLVAGAVAAPELHAPPAPGGAGGAGGEAEVVGSREGGGSCCAKRSLESLAPDISGEGSPPFAALAAAKRDVLAGGSSCAFGTRRLGGAR